MFTLSQAAKKLNVSNITICNWANEGNIKFITLPGSKRRRYILDDILDEKKKPNERIGIIYARVSTSKQRDDLGRQIDSLREKYPDHLLIKDICSGINYKRKGLFSLVDLVMQGNVSEVVVAYRDRLCRFGYEIFELLFKKYGTKLVVLNHKECSKEEELVQDLLSIVTVFSCRTNGLRKYKKQIKEDIEKKENKKSKDEEKKETS